MGERRLLRRVRPAILGFHESLRCELLHDKSNVHVTMVQLPAVNTPSSAGYSPACRSEPSPYHRSTNPAVLRAWLGIHFGIGRQPDVSDQDTTKGANERKEGRFPDKIPATMTTAVVILLVGGLLVGVVPIGEWTWTGVWLGLLSAALAVAIGVVGANFGLGRLRPMVKSPLRVVHRLHSGHVGDYVAWLLLGMTVVGALLALT